MKKIILSFILLAFINSSFAQEADTYTASVKKMLKAAGTEEIFNTMIRSMFAMFKQNKSNVPENVWADLEQEFLQTSLDDLVQMISPIYKKHFSEAELQSVTAFYETPTGKKFASKSPVVMQESMQIGQAWGAKVGEKFQEKLKAKGY